MESARSRPLDDIKKRFNIEKEETNSKVANLSPIMSVTTFNLNVLIAIKNKDYQTG